MKKIKRTVKIIILMLLCLTVFASSGCSDERESPVQEEIQTVRVMFPEGSTVSEIASLLEKNGVCSAEEFRALANDASLASEFGITIENPENRAFLLEGYLYPDTYDFYVGESAERAIRRFLKNSSSKLNDELKEECRQAGMTLDEMLTLASIIQEEAGNPEEMFKVSSVLHNRLNSKKFPRLQCDVTIGYLEKRVKPYVSQEKYDSLRELYNTYKCKGLPEGPITNVGSSAIDAALHPENSDWYFFISDNNGEYHYAETWEEHLENCDKAGI